MTAQIHGSFAEIENEAIEELVNRLSPDVQQTIKKDLLWKVRCFMNYERAKKEHDETTACHHEGWASW